MDGHEYAELVRDADRRTLTGVVIDLSHEIVPERLGAAVLTEMGQATRWACAGTCLDSPFHVDTGRADLANLPLQRLVNVPIATVRAYARRQVTADHLGDPGLLWGKAVLLHTGWARRWGTPAYRQPGSPHLTHAAIDALIGANVALVGIDAVAVDDPDDPGRRSLLGADIPILEHLTNLDLLPETGARLTVLPPPIRGVASFPVRVVAVLPR